MPSNPVLPGFHPDPSICRVGETFYLTTSSFEYVPGLPLYRSENLVDWEPIGHALTRESQLDTRDARTSGGIFAPTIREHDGTFYLTSTNTSGGGHFVVTAEDPAGEWSDPVSVDAPGIDPDLFFEGDTCYFTYFTTDDDRRIEQAEIDPGTGELGEQYTVWTGHEDPHAEAPHLYERAGSYYLVVAEGGTHTGHSVMVGRSDDPTGPFDPHPQNPILTHRDDFYRDVHAAGHADFVTDADGNWWLVCLGIRPRGGFPGWHHLGRETFLAPVSWDEGWPVVESGAIPPEIDADTLPGDPARADADPDPVEHTDTDFSEGRSHEFLYRRTPDRDRYAFTDDGLVLRGGPETLDETGTTFLARRQTNFDCRIRADLVFDPDPGEEAGLALVMDEQHHYEVGVVGGGDGDTGGGAEGGSTALVRVTVGDATDVLARESVGERATLGVDATAENYEFRVDGEVVAEARSKYLSTEVAGGFTGVTVGPYAVADGGPADATPARVERFVYEPAE
ncbi:glycoside hydrolase family 43 [Halosimplex carlsbadense 2-9-1]|uniref:Glycoside hydrolase family 43 n=1 Tax=Halosimplex carlsbadense 2-9-1 TaxID=797114 RepID=M0CAN2_9EURY|nr:glycoside hydrolase family 43 protein [Halosimplex carlsbadense]ELZ20300.1 glycoside hydrolase family 43 [Halosimplex carlsbadense 2-9-1]